MSVNILYENTTACPIGRRALAKGRWAACGKLKFFCSKHSSNSGQTSVRACSSHIVVGWPVSQWSARNPVQLLRSKAIRLLAIQPSSRPRGAPDTPEMAEAPLTSRTFQLLHEAAEIGPLRPRRQRDAGSGRGHGIWLPPWARRAVRLSCSEHAVFDPLCARASTGSAQHRNDDTVQLGFSVIWRIMVGYGGNRVDLFKLSVPVSALQWTERDAL